MPRVLGLCDEGETAFFVRALTAHGLDASTEESAAAIGFHVCHADLEDELIRALGDERVLGALGALGLQKRFAAFCQQPAWSQQLLSAQLRRFAGVASGRKALLAEALTSALRPHEVPRPLVELVGQLRLAVADEGLGGIRPFPKSTT
jgi:hypothetical protein